MGRYWGSVIRRAFRESLQTIGQTVGTLGFAAIGVALGLALVWYLKGLDAMKAEVLTSAIQVLGIALLAWLPFFIWHLLRTPARMQAEEKAIAAGLEQDKQQLSAQLDSSKPRFFVNDFGIKDVALDVSVGPTELHQRIEMLVHLEVENGRRAAKDVGGRFIFAKSPLVELPLIAGAMDSGYAEQRFLNFRQPLPVLMPNTPRCFMATEIVFSDPETRLGYRQTWYWEWAGIDPNGLFESIFTNMTKSDTDRFVDYLNQKLPGGWIK